MKKYLLPSIRLTIVLIVICSVLYPLLIAGIAQLAPGRGNGVTIQQNGKTAGYANIGQQFTQDRYFHGRPSAVNYNAAGSGGSNKGPSNPDYLKTVQERIDTFLAHNPGTKVGEIPSELVTASGSGLDPHISPASAQIQVKRVAAERGLPENTIKELVKKHTSSPLLNMLGTPTINVLQLNTALDQLK
jgi:potassium-transporting ATPase KdpC subunit